MDNLPEYLAALLRLIALGVSAWLAVVLLAIMIFITPLSVGLLSVMIICVVFGFVFEAFGWSEISQSCFAAREFFQNFTLGFLQVIATVLAVPYVIMAGAWHYARYGQIPTWN